MKISIEVRFNIGDFVRLKSDSKEPQCTKMQVQSIMTNGYPPACYLCLWMIHGSIQKILLDEASLELWGNKENENLDS